MALLQLLALVFFSDLLTACGRGPVNAPLAHADTQPLSRMAQVGQKLFFDPSLSASGTQSCTSCHSPAYAFAPGNDFSVQLGGPDMQQQGARAVPSLRYQSETPAFSIGPDDPADNDADQDHPRMARHPSLLATVRPTVAKSATPVPGVEPLVPQGGFFWDGRAGSLARQALGPLLNPVEMANANPEALADKIRQAPYAAEFARLVDPHVLEDRRRLPSYAAFAIAAYEKESADFHPYDSKYDEYLRGLVKLSPAEQRGLALFEDPKKGNCAACHLDKKTPDGRMPLFTDFQYEALGVPRNPAIRLNASPDYFDLGICGPSRRDAYARQDQNCAMFKTPSLRNVATRHAFFHNGVFHNLEDVLHFYVERDTNPEKFYPRRADGSVAKFDDAPPSYWANIDTLDAPLNRKPGDKPALNEAEIQDVIAFLQTLTDGYGSSRALAQAQ